jgi:hypothetical protein
MGNRESGMAITYKELRRRRKKLAAEFKPPSPITAGAVTYNE